MDQHVAPSGSKYHHQARQQDERGHARLDQLPHDPEAGLVHSPGLASDDGHQRDDRNDYRRQTGHPAGQAGAGGRRGDREPRGQQGSARLHEPPDHVVVEGGAALQPVSLMAAKNHRHRDQPPQQRDKRAPDEPLAAGGDMKSGHLGGNQVDQKHKADRRAAGKGEPARQG